MIYHVMFYDGATLIPAPMFAKDKYWTKKKAISATLSLSRFTTMPLAIVRFGKVIRTFSKDEITEG